MKKIYIKVMLLAAFVLTAGSLIYLLFLQKTVDAQTITRLRENIQDPDQKQDGIFFVGTKDGLYKIDKSIQKIFPEEVFKIVPSPTGLWILTKNNIFFSSNHKSFEARSSGIRQKVLKSFNDVNTSLTKENELLKDLSLDPNNPNNLVTAGVNGVYYTTDAGKNWSYVPSESATNGIKSVGIFSWNEKLYILFGHPYKGVFYKATDEKKWNIVDAGLSYYGGFRDEISSISVSASQNSESYPTIYISQNFDPKIFRLDIPTKKLLPIFTPQKKAPVQLLESLQKTQTNRLLYVQNNGVQIYDFETKKAQKWDKIRQFLEYFQKSYSTQVQTISAFYEGKNLYSLSELWMLSPPELTENQKLASNKRGIYAQADALRNNKRLTNILALSRKTNLNMIVVDMKDDFGYLRFNPKDPSIIQKGVVQNPVNLSRVLKVLKSNGIYVVARIPVFKDTILYKHNNGEFAVKSKSEGTPWMGLRRTSNNRLVPTKEYWVDPYNEYVWQYNADIAEDLIKQGVDEIQFDYIRFPTDGTNLSDVSYPSQEPGMDKEGALISFLRYVRNRISAPISIDIYGANGWMRTGARTGQDVELLSLYSDVIAPMYYPSHFGKGFLNFSPYELRPYRIYNLGSYRNYYIARQKSIIRPYIQAFTLPNNAYDIKYYGPEYINLQIRGIDESINLGYTFWNSSTRYSILYDTLLNKQGN